MTSVITLVNLHFPVKEEDFSNRSMIKLLFLYEIKKTLYLIRNTMLK